MSGDGDAIASGRATLGIELGSTRIKACLIGDDPSTVIASGAHEWENQLVDGMWTYSLEAVWAGLQAAYADLVSDVESRFGVVPTGYSAIGVSAMMHGYLAFDEAGELLVPFRTWRNTTTGEASAELSGLFGVNIPLRWSIAHLHQAVRDAEPHVPQIRFLTTLAGYVHWQLTGRRVLGVGDASGMFPIDPTTRDYDARFPRALRPPRRGQRAVGAAPRAAAGGPSRRSTGGGAHRRRRGTARPLRSTASRDRLLPAGGRRGHRHGRDQRDRAAHRQRQRRHEHLRDGRPRAPAAASAPRARRRHDARRRSGRDGPLQQRRERTRRVGGDVPTLRGGRGHARSTPTPSTTPCSGRPSRARRTPAACSPTTTWRGSRSPA